MGETKREEERKKERERRASKPKRNEERKKKKNLDFVFSFQAKRTLELNSTERKKQQR